MDDSLENSTNLNPTGAKCMPFTKDEPMDIKVVKAACYSIIMLISLLGNSALIAIVARYKHMQTTTNLLIANMAISDLMVSAFAVPRELAQIFTGVQRWLIDGTAGVILYKLVYFFQDISTAVSIQSILVITVDRYAGVVQPYRDPIITPRRRRVLMPLIWLIAMGLHSTYLYTLRLKQVNSIRYCIFSWEPAFDSLQAQRIYFVAISVILIVIPLAVITVLYSLMFRSILKQRSFWKTVSSFRRQRRKEDTKIIKKILAIIVLFVICILPIDITGLLHLFAWQEKIPCGIDHWSFAVKFIFYSNASLNPCVYFLLNERYRQSLWNLLKCRDSQPESQATMHDMALRTLK